MSKKISKDVLLERLDNICKDMKELKDFFVEHEKSSNFFRETVTSHSTAIKWVSSALTLIFAVLGYIIFSSI